MILLPVSYQVDLKPRDIFYLDTNGYFTYIDSSLHQRRNIKVKDDETLLISYLKRYNKECCSKHGKYNTKKSRVVIAKKGIEKELFKPDKSFSYVEPPKHVGYLQYKELELDIWLIYCVGTMDLIKRQKVLADTKGRNR